MNSFPVTTDSKSSFSNVGNLMRTKRGPMQVFTVTYGTTKQAIIASANTYAGILYTEPGRRFVIHSASLTMDGQGYVKATMYPSSPQQVTGGTADAFPPYLNYTDQSTMYFNTIVAQGAFSTNGGHVDVDFPGGLIMHENSNISVNYVSPNSVSNAITLTVTGYYEVEDDFFDAKYSIEVISDSTGWYPMGLDSNNLPYLGKWLWNFQLRDALRNLNKTGFTNPNGVSFTNALPQFANGIDVRLDNNGFGGSRMVDVFYGTETNRFSDTANLKIISCGMNDANNDTGGRGNPTTQAKYLEALNAVIARRNRINPNQWLLFLAPQNSDMSTRATNLPSVRNWIRSVATGQTANKILFYDTSQAVPLNATATADTNYRNYERFAGSRVHLSGLGHTLVNYNLNGDSDNGIAAGQPSGVFPLINMYANQIFK